MIIINNVPCRYVKEFPTEIEFVLLHKLMDNEFYRQHFIDCRNNGKYKILDNSVYELGKVLNSKLLMDYAELINANEIIIPDVYGDKEKTLQLMNDFLEKYPDCPYKLQAVIQGKNEDEMIECCKVMNETPEIDVLGLNKLTRANFDCFTSIIPHIYNKGIHLLGVNKLSDWAEYNFEGIRSADSRILSKLVTGIDDPWEEELSGCQIGTLHRLIAEVERWQ